MPTVFTCFVGEEVENQLAAEMDRQLWIDCDLVEAQLDTNAAGKIRWLVQGAHGDGGFARLSAGFEVWSEDRPLLIRHGPVQEADIRRSVCATNEIA